MFFLIENQCKFGSHQEVNAGWLAHLARVFPDEKIFFLSALSHWARVQQALPRGEKSRARALWAPLWALRAVSFFVVHLGQLRPETEINAVFLSNIRGAQLTSAFSESKVDGGIHTKVFGVVHRGFEIDPHSTVDYPTDYQRQVLRKRRVNRRIPVLYNFENVVLSARNVVRLLSNAFQGRGRANSSREGNTFDLDVKSSVNRIVLSSHILRNTDTAISSIQSVMMPFSIFPDETLPVVQPNFEQNKLVLATIGTGNNEVFLKLFDELFSKGQKANVYIKALTMNSRGFDRFSEVKSFRWGRIPRRVVKKNLSDVSFLLFPYGLQEFQRSASGSQMEILRFGIPHISMRNFHLEEMHRKFGDVGTICDTFSSWASTIRNFAENPSLAKVTWERQTRNLQTARWTYVQTIEEDLRKVFTRSESSSS